MRRIFALWVLPVLVLCSPNASCATGKPRTAEEAIQQSGATEWSLVAVGDTYMQLMGPPYAELLQEHLEITVTPKVWVVNTPQELITKLSEGSPLREAIAGADILLFQVPIHDLATYATEVDKVITQIVALRSPLQAITRTIDSYAGGDFSIDQILEANKHLSEMATEQQIQVAKVFEKFNGVTGGLDPVSQGYLVPGSLQLTEAGIDTIVELIYNIGTGYGLYDCS